MVLKAPNMEKCTQKCKCGFGKNLDVVYDLTDPCEGVGTASDPSLFNPLTCDCDVVAVAGPIQWMATAASQNLWFKVAGDNANTQQMGVWFPMMNTDLFSQTNGNGNLYLHSPRVYNVQFSGDFVGTCNESAPSFPSDISQCVIDCTPWPTYFFVKKETDTCTCLGCYTTSMMLPILLRYDPDTGEQVLLNNNCSSGSLASGYHFSPSLTPVCRDIELPPGDPNRTKEEPQGTIWETSLSWRYAKKDLFQAGTFDPLNDSHWNYIG